jgi:hypothetical protein
VLTGFGDADTSSEIRGLELRPEPMPRAFLVCGERGADGGGTCIADRVSAQGRRLTAKR